MGQRRMILCELSVEIEQVGQAATLKDDISSKVTRPSRSDVRPPIKPSKVTGKVCSDASYEARPTVINL
ncbi:hypothetical protein RB195_005154 [Necator americanus]|uniref:Uncharacterized protein n=1 Tax=Necator americanus TaxID=51031 RepID=A0ABR1BLF7_NECAM